MRGCLTQHHRVHGFISISGLVPFARSLLRCPRRNSIQYLRVLYASAVPASVQSHHVSSRGYEMTVRCLRPSNDSQAISSVPKVTTAVRWCGLVEIPRKQLKYEREECEGEATFDVSVSSRREMT